MHSRDAFPAPFRQAPAEGEPRTGRMISRSRLAALVATAWLLIVAVGPVAAADPFAPPPGPPFPDPAIDRAVYDFAGILGAATIADAEAIIDAIEARTGAEIVIYTQDSGELQPHRRSRPKPRRGP